MVGNPTPKPFPVPKPPYKPGTLHKPLTPDQRRKALAYIKLASGVETNKDINDGNLIKLYDDIASGKGIPISDPGVLGDIVNIGIAIDKPIQGAVDAAMSVSEFLGKLGAFLFNPVRMGELVIGVILVGVGTNAILHNPAGKVASAAPVRKAVKAASVAKGVKA